MQNPDDFNTSVALPVGDDNVALTLRKAKEYDYFIILPDDKGKTYWDLIITLYFATVVLSDVGCCFLCALPHRLELRFLMKTT